MLNISGKFIIVVIPHASSTLEIMYISTTINSCFRINFRDIVIQIARIR